MASSLGMKIGARRRELGISLERLAELTDSSKSYLWELENRDKPNPSVDKVNKIALALNLTPETLLGSATEICPGEESDSAFFRKYQSLEESDKKRLRKIVDAWWEEGDGEKSEE
ncbi:helix-turn-helix transcriptional regulator [Pseudomonas sp. TWI929]|uniref:helix-turn-helix domain-containing protein n=1 Tax=Pseudomonas sp. TWI929 TaxID=3136795 RepID=UPI00320B3C58